DELVVAHPATGIDPQPRPDLPRDVRDAEHLRADVPALEDRLRPEDAAVAIAHPEDADAVRVLRRKPPHRHERVLRELVVVVHEDQVRALRALDHALPGLVAEVHVPAAADEDLVARLELLDDARELAEERWAP